MSDNFGKFVGDSLVALALKIVALIIAAACSGCLEASAGPAAKPEAAIDFSQLLDDAEGHSRVPALPDDLKPTPETGTLPPPAAPVPDRPSEPMPQPTVGTDPGAATLPVVLVYGPPHCAPCARAIRELNETDRYDAHKAAITPALQKIANEWNQGGFPIVTFTDTKGLERFVAPYRGVRDFDQRYNRTMKERAATGSQDAAPPNVAAHVFNATEFVQAWGIRSHLVRDHGFTESQVAAMTDQQVIDAHNAAHQVWGGFTGKRPGRLARRGKL